MGSHVSRGGEGGSPGSPLNIDTETIILRPRVLFRRVRYYIEDPERDPDLENYPCVYEVFCLYSYGVSSSRRSEKTTIEGGDQDADGSDAYRTTGTAVMRIVEFGVNPKPQTLLQSN